jgi:hypothetical protein
MVQLYDPWFKLTLRAWPLAPPNANGGNIPAIQALPPLVLGGAGGHALILGVIGNGTVYYNTLFMKCQLSMRPYLRSGNTNG